MDNRLTVIRWPMMTDDTVPPFITLCLPDKPQEALAAIGRASMHCQVDGMTRLLYTHDGQFCGGISAAEQEDQVVCVDWWPMPNGMFGFRRAGV